MQTRLHESEKKTELMAMTLRTLIKNTAKEKGEEPHDGEGEDSKHKE